MYAKVKKILGYWTVRLESNGLTQFKSLSRKKATTWRDTNKKVEETTCNQKKAGA